SMFRVVRVASVLGWLLLGGALSVERGRMACGRPAISLGRLCFSPRISIHYLAETWSVWDPCPALIGRLCHSFHSSQLRSPRDRNRKPRGESRRSLSAAFSSCRHSSV